MHHPLQSLPPRSLTSPRGPGSVPPFFPDRAWPARPAAKGWRLTIPLRGILAACILVLLAGGMGRAHAPDARAEIDSLLAFVGRQQDMAFIRNGSPHTAQEAVSHLRFKRERAGNRLKTAEDFILYCATRSYFTRVPYRVRYPDGTTRKAADVLNEELRRLRAARESSP